MFEPGAEAIVEGPYGSFSHRNVPNRKQIWIAGGIGVTPFLSMARSLCQEDEPSVDFYYGVEHEPEAPSSRSSAPSPTAATLGADTQPGRRTRLMYAAFVAGALSLYGLMFGVVVATGGRGEAERGGSTTAVTTSGRQGSAAAGKAVFASAGCRSCHALKAAGSDGRAGPDLDESKPDAVLVRDVVANGKGSMPPFEGRLTDQEIRDVAAFVSASAGR